MSEAQETWPPEPWAFNWWNYEDWPHGDVTCGDELICQVKDQEHGRLIAAAPTMARVLRDTLPRLVPFGPWMGNTADLERVIAYLDGKADSPQ